MSTRSIRLAILGSFNLDLLRGPLTAELARRGITAELYFSGYSQWESDAANDRSDLVAFQPEVVIVLADAADLLPVLHVGKMTTNNGEAQSAGDQAWRRLRRVLDLLGERLSPDGMILAHNLAAPPTTALGMLEGNAGYSHREAAELVNRQLRTYCQDDPRRVVLDYAALVADHGWRNWHDPRMWYLGRIRLSRAAVGQLAICHARYLAAALTPRRKCLVLDLDNTLWGGILGEDGIHGLELGHQGPGLAFREFQMAALALAQRGVILAVCSKNNPDDAFEVLAKHPEMVLRPQHFACLEISWDPKPAAIERIAVRLNIGPESLVFWDDNPREREAVRSLCPLVLVPEVPGDVALHAGMLLDLECFDQLSLTDEDRRRGEMYRQQVQRQQFQDQAAADDPSDYHASLGMEAVFQAADPFAIPRIAQLTQRTNQFNLTTRRYNEAEVRQMADSPEHDVYSASLRDRFGDLGLIGAAILQRTTDNWRLDTYLVSCRALGRGLEDAFLSFLAAQAHAAGAELHGTFITTKRNRPAREFLDRLAVPLEPLDETNYAFCITPADVPPPAWIRVNQGNQRA